MTTFGDHCKILRSRMRLTMTAVAEKMGYKQPYLTQIENGKYPPTMDFLRNCLNVYTIMDAEERGRFTAEVLPYMKKVELSISDITLIHRENLIRLLSMLVLNEEYPLGSIDMRIWTPAKQFIKIMKQEPQTYKPNVFELGFRENGNDD
jgi:transcriptional regulator with XRE-family HTH domain